MAVVSIAELRARHGKMSQKELAEVLGTTQTSVSLWEKDIQTISAPYLKKVCAFFKVSSDELLGIDSQPKIFYHQHDLKSYVRGG